MWLAWKGDLGFPVRVTLGDTGGPMWVFRVGHFLCPDWMNLNVPVRFFGMARDGQFSGWDWSLSLAQDGHFRGPELQFGLSGKAILGGPRGHFLYPGRSLCLTREIHNWLLRWAALDVPGGPRRPLYDIREGRFG